MRQRTECLQKQKLTSTSNKTKQQSSCDDDVNVAVVVFPAQFSSQICVSSSVSCCGRTPSLCRVSDGPSWACPSPCPGHVATRHPSNFPCPVISKIKAMQCMKLHNHLTYTDVNNFSKTRYASFPGLYLR